MSDKKIIEYDHESSLSFIGSLETMCGLMGGFVFTGTMVVLTGLGDPSALISQVVLFILSSAHGMFMMALWELHYMNILVSLHSPKLIIPNYPNKWRIINTLITLGTTFEMFAINLMFLLKNLRELFVLSLCIAGFSFVFMHFYRWKPIKEEMARVYTKIFQTD